MQHALLALLILTLLPNCTRSQGTQVGGPCEDCEALLDYRLLSLEPQAWDTLPGFQEHEPKIKITGTVYQADGKTPAPHILLYIYHVNREGIYQASDHPIGMEKRHGQYRGWLKTGPKGQYTFFTFRPVPYPDQQEPEHIHIYLKEPHTPPYYIDNFLFESDPMLTKAKKQSQKNRGGSGIIQLVKKNGIWTAQRDIILGLNIPNYN